MILETGKPCMTVKADQMHPDDRGKAILCLLMKVIMKNCGHVLKPVEIVLFGVHEDFDTLRIDQNNLVSEDTSKLAT